MPGELHNLKQVPNAFCCFRTQTSLLCCEAPYWFWGLRQYWRMSTSRLNFRVFTGSGGESNLSCFHDWQKLSHSGISGHAVPGKNGMFEVFLMRNARPQKYQSFLCKACTRCFCNEVSKSTRQERSAVNVKSTGSGLKKAELKLRKYPLCGRVYVHVQWCSMSAAGGWRSHVCHNCTETTGFRCRAVISWIQSGRRFKIERWSDNGLKFMIINTQRHTCQSVQRWGPSPPHIHI